MKSEDKIVEILAESLKKQDQHGKVDGLRSDFIKLFDFLQTKQDKLEDRVKWLEDGFFKA